MERTGLPFLERLSSYEGAAEFWLKEGWHFHDAADLFYYAGDLDRARRALEAGLAKFANPGTTDVLQELPQLELRMERYFGRVGV